MADPQSLFPRTVAINRPAPEPRSGDVGDFSLSQTAETVIFSGLSASIQFASDGAAPAAGVPSDAVGRTLWKVLLQASSTLPPGSIQQNDVVVDDAGLRYNIAAAYWSSLGFTLRAELDNN